MATNSRVRSSLSCIYQLRLIRSHVASFADGNLTDVIKHIALNPDNNVDKRVQKKMMLVLMSWHEQFKSDPSMTVVAGLYQQCKREKRHVYELTDAVGLTDNSELKRRAEKEEAKRKAKQEKEEARERARLQEEEREERRRKEKQNKNRPRRAPFDFEKVSTLHLSRHLYSCQRFLRKSPKSSPVLSMHHRRPVTWLTLSLCVNMFASCCYSSLIKTM